LDPRITFLITFIWKDSIKYGRKLSNKGKLKEFEAQFSSFGGLDAHSAPVVLILIILDKSSDQNLEPLAS